MVDIKSVEGQLKKINFNPHAWGQAEVKELPHILLDHEEIYEVVNGIYDGGFALLVATNVRLLLVDKKPLNFLTVEDMRFDMINELDYSHRLIGARINVSAGNKNLSFMSFNQQRLRKAIGHVQRCMAEAKKQQSDHQVDQKQHLAQINQQLQAYLLAQHQQQESLRQELEAVQGGKKSPDEVKIDAVKPSPELSDYLLAQSLMQQVNLPLDEDKQGADTEQPSSDKQADSMATMMKLEKSKEPAGKDTAREADKESKELDEPEVTAALPAESVLPEADLPPRTPQTEEPATPQLSELYAEGMKEVFGKRAPSKQQASNKQTDEAAAAPQASEAAAAGSEPADKPVTADNKFPYLTRYKDVNPLQIAYGKLPLALRNKKFGRPSFHAHSQADDITRHAPQVAGA